nr:hypothetical protein BaRGS_035203 [Batillaria attramentaria]
MYNLTFQFAGACPVIVPSSQVPVLSAGSVLLLIFFVSMIMYFVLGCFVNIARGKTGQEIVPHHMFWTMLPVYIMEGIQFTLSCGQRQAGKTYESI